MVSTSSSTTSSSAYSDESRNVLVGTLCLVGGAILCVLSLHVAAYFFWKQAVKNAPTSSDKQKTTKLLWTDDETSNQASKQQHKKTWTLTPRLVLETILPTAAWIGMTLFLAWRMVFHSHEGTIMVLHLILTALVMWILLQGIQCEGTTVSKWLPILYLMALCAVMGMLMMILGLQYHGLGGYDQVIWESNNRGQNSAQERQVQWPPRAYLTDWQALIIDQQVGGTSASRLTIQYTTQNGKECQASLRLDCNNFVQEIQQQAGQVTPEEKHDLILTRIDFVSAEYGNYQDDQVYQPFFDCRKGPILNANEHYNSQQEHYNRAQEYYDRYQQQQAYNNYQYNFNNRRKLEEQQQEERAYDDNAQDDGYDNDQSYNGAYGSDDTYDDAYNQNDDTSASVDSYWAVNGLFINSRQCGHAALYSQAVLENAFMRPVKGMILCAWAASIAVGILLLRQYYVYSKGRSNIDKDPDAKLKVSHKFFKAQDLMEDEATSNAGAREAGV